MYMYMYIHIWVQNGISLSHKKDKILSFITKWIDLENIVLSEISQKNAKPEKSKLKWKNFFLTQFDSFFSR